jgi:hypothetical protein
MEWQHNCKEELAVEHENNPKGVIECKSSKTYNCRKKLTKEEREALKEKSDTERYFKLKRNIMKREWKNKDVVVIDNEVYGVGMHSSDDEPELKLKSKQPRASRRTGTKNIIK